MEKDLKPILKTTVFGASFNEDEINQLLKFGHYVVFNPGQTIVHQGKKSPGMYVILAGTALVTTKILGEGGTYITTLGPGNLISEITLIEKGLCPTTVIASNRLESLLITTEFFDALNIFNQTTKYKMTHSIAREIINRFKEMRNKIKNFIISSSMTSFSFFGSLVKSFNQPLEIPLDEKLVHQLRTFLLFKHFTKNELDKLISYGIFLKAAKHTTLINEGDPYAPLYILLRGAVQTSIVENKKMAKLSVLGPPSIFTGIQIVEDQITSMLNYNTCESAILLKISWENLLLLKNEHAVLWIKVFDLLCKTFVALERSANRLDVRLNSELYNR